MKYKCFDTFVIRSSLLPKSYFEKLSFYGTEMIFDLYQSEDKDVIEEALKVSSESLFNSLREIPEDVKRKRNLKYGLIKYLTRMSTRPTPYGLFAGVGLGTFGEKSNILQAGDYIKSVNVDRYWIEHIIHVLEQNEEILFQLKVKWNNICYRSGNRIINPYFANHGDTYYEKEGIEEISVRRTALMDIIKNQAPNYIYIKDLASLLKEYYNGVDIQKIKDTLAELVEDEILLTDLRIPAYCEEPLKHVIRVLSNIQCDKNFLHQLKNIDELIEKYKTQDLGRGMETLNFLYGSMEKLFKSKNYIEVNLGKKYISNKLSDKIRKTLENFVEELSYLWVDSNDFSELSEFKQQFCEQYGFNVEVPLIEVIDSNGFDGLRFLKSNSYNKSKRETVIRDIVDQKILEAIYERKDEITLCQKDFDIVEKVNTNFNYPVTFDMNFFIHFNNENKDLYDIEVGPIGGAPKAGMLIQRFSNALDPKLFNEYSKLYNQEKLLTEKKYINVEQREYISAGRGENVINNRCNYDFCLCMACCPTEDKDEILLSDLYVGLAENRKLYIKSKKYNKIIKIVSDNMLNPRLNGKILYLLKQISYEYENGIISRLFSLYNNKYSYIPRIVLAGVVILPKTWIFDDKIFASDNMDCFMNKLFNLRQTYHIDRFVYLCEADNRLQIDLDDDNYVRILYNTFKKEKKIILCEIGKGKNISEIGRDEKGNEYILEISTSFYLPLSSKEKKNAFISKGTVCSANREIMLGKEGWIYFKLYGKNTRSDEIITQYIEQLEEETKPEKLFFIRYSDTEKHLRIRLKYKTRSEAIRQIGKLMLWYQTMRENGVVKNIIFDTYYRENNRYGGENLIDDIEEFFYRDSKFVISILQNFDIEDKEKLEILYFFGMVSILKELANGIKEMFEIMNNYSDNPEIRRHYKKSRKKYEEMFAAMLGDNYIQQTSFENIKESYIKRKKSLEKIKSRLEENLIKGRLMNSKEKIILSLMHMYCNRLYGYNPYEEKYSILLRNTLHDKLSKLNNYERRGGEDELESGIV